MVKVGHGAFFTRDEVDIVMRAFNAVIAVKGNSSRLFWTDTLDSQQLAALSDKLSMILEAIDLEQRSKHS